MTQEKLMTLEHAVTDMVLSYQPRRKTFAVRNRMRYLALLGMEKTHDIRMAFEMNDETEMDRIFEEFKTEYERVLSKSNSTLENS